MTRHCGECQLCCELVPVKEIGAAGKAANERCTYQRRGRRGCSIYARRPDSCRYWSCQWLINAGETAKLSRPDRCHYVIDPIPDYVGFQHEGSAGIEHIMAVQVWIDPRFPAAHQDQSLRRFLYDTWQAALVRYGSREVLLLIPPEEYDGEWLERKSQPHDQWVEHSEADLLAALIEGHRR